MTNPVSHILAFDLGTSSVRGLVLDADARPVPGALARRKVALGVDADGTGTIDPAAYLGWLVECLDELAAGGHLDGVTLVAASAQWHSVLPLRADGSPAGPVLTWLDSRPVADTASGAGGAGPADPQAFHDRTGAWWHGLYWSVRLPWLRTRLGERVARFVGLPEYVVGALVGDLAMSVSQASGTGLMDLRAADWDAEACALAGVRPDELPMLAPPGWRGRLRPEFARRWPALRDAAWAAPVGDGAASNFGSGACDASRAAVTVGTSAAVRLVQPSPRGALLPPLSARLWRYRVDHDRIVTGAAYSNGGNLYAWAQREFRLPEGAALDEALHRHSTGVLADPRLGGERPPGRTPAGSGALRGIGFTTTAVDMLAALLEAVCRQVAEDVGELEAGLTSPVAVNLGGGAVAASLWWRRAFRAVLAPRDVVDVTEPEVGAIGAALIAAGQVD